MGNSPSNISSKNPTTVDDVLKDIAEESDAAIPGWYQQAALYLKLDAFTNGSPLAEKACFIGIFEFLVIKEIIYQVMETLVLKQITIMMDAARTHNRDVTPILNSRQSNICVIGNLRIDKTQAIIDAMELHEIICRHYSHDNSKFDRITRSVDELYGFRKVSLTLAVRVALLAQLRRVHTKLVMNTFVEVYTPGVDWTNDSATPATAHHTPNATANFQAPAANSSQPPPSTTNTPTPTRPASNAPCVNHQIWSLDGKLILKILPKVIFHIGKALLWALIQMVCEGSS